MKGVMTILMNHDTMLEAVQLWIDKNFVEGARPKATEIAPKEGSSYRDQKEFAVTVNDGSIVG